MSARFDLLVKGGEVVDPGGGLSGSLDVAVRGGRVAAVEADIPAAAAREVIDAAGQLVTPGLVDLHTHVYRGVTYWGIHADALAWRTGVTTWLDVGSAGAYTLQGFRQWIAEPARVRVQALLNISSVGLVAENWELANLGHCDVDLCRTLVDRNRDLVLGIKARIGTPTVGENGLEPLRRARRVADETELPLMVHIAHGPPGVEDVLDLMRPGDILTHCATGTSMRLVDDAGRVIEAARRARDAGVVFDVGHGFGSFMWESAEALLAADMAPDVISSDAHQLSVQGPMFDLPTCLAKYVALGMSLADVIRAATARPAEAIGMAGEVGTLAPGALADIAVWRAERGPVTFYDVNRRPREGDLRLENTLTLVGGVALPPHAVEAPAPWVELTDAQREYHRAARSAAATSPHERLSAPEHFIAAPPALGPEPAPTTAPLRVTGSSRVDERVEALLDEPLEPTTKALPPHEPGTLTARTIGAQGWNLLAGDLLLPAVVLRETALAHNVGLMADFCAARGVSLAPHGKTTMAPQIFARQLAAGAWGMTAATISQVRAYREWGVQRVLMANELVQPAALDWLAAELDGDPGFSFLCLVDSLAGVERMTRALGAVAARRPIPVLVEQGALGARAGARTLDEALSVGRAVVASPALELAGVEGYEGTIGGERSPATLERVDAFLERLASLARVLDGEGAFADRGELVVTAGGSAFFDHVVDRLGALEGLSLPVRLVLRSGCYVTHDHGMYAALSPLAAPDGLRAALELWGEVLSLPEPGLAIVGLGKRDSSYDVGLPVPLVSVRDGGSPVPLEGRAVVTELNDQHAYLRVRGAALAVGDLVGCGISHPCTTFDKWRVIPTVDDSYHVTGGIRTYF